MKVSVEVSVELSVGVSVEVSVENMKSLPLLPERETEMGVWPR